MTENQDLVDFDSLCGVPSEDLFEKLLSDATFVDFFNTFLSLPVFGKRLSYNRTDDNFTIDPPPPRTYYHLPCFRVKKWVRKERIKFFWKTDLFLEYLLYVNLREAAESSNTSVDLEQAKSYLGTTENMHSFHRFLRGTTGQNILFFWIDAERFRRVTSREHRRFAFRDIQAKYLRSGSPRELPEVMKWASICGGTPGLERKSSFKFPKSVINRMYLSDASIFSENVFIPGQKMALERLISYWVPKFIEHKKKIRRLIKEKRLRQSGLQLSPRRFSFVQEVNDEVPFSKTEFEDEMDDFMAAQCVSSTESVMETEDEIRARKLEEWKRWFWDGVDENEPANEDEVEPPKDMPEELLRLGGIRHISPSSPVAPDTQDTIVIPEEEDWAISNSRSSDGGRQSVEGNSLSFYYPRCRVISPKEHSLSEPAFTSADLMRWHESLGRAKEEERDILEENRVNLPTLPQPYALLPTSAPRKLKTQYEALASEQSMITQDQEAEELCESSTASNSPNRSFSASPPQTALLALRRASAARVIPFEEISQEIAAMVSKPRAAYPRAIPQPDQLIPYDSSTDLCKSNQIIIQAIVALTADKLAGGPLREHLKKTQEKTALRSLQFWEDAQRYLLPLEDFGSYSKFHSAKTLIATYIAPDSPRQMAMSPRVRDDLMRLLPGEKGDHLLATVVKNSVQAVTLPWSKYVRSDEDHFVNSVGIPRRSANKRTDNKRSKPTASEERTMSWKAVKLAVGFGVADLYLGQDDDDNEELEAFNFDFKIPSLKDHERQLEMLNTRSRRASHYYGHITRQSEDSSEGNEKITLNKLRPPKPRGFNDILRDTLQLMWFKRFLGEKQCEAPLLFWQAVENLKTNCKDGKARQARATTIVKKYFTNIPMPAVEYLYCKAEIIRDIPLLDKTTPPMLVSAQACVARSMEENWYSDYLATFPEDESEGENFGKYAMRNTLAGVCKLAAHGKTRGLWAMFAHNIMLFQRGIHNPDSLSEFKTFLRKEAKTTLELNLRRHSVYPTRRMVNSKVVNTDRLISDLEFWMEVERFKSQADNAAECARSGNYTLEDENLLLDKAKTIVKCYIDSEVPPRVQVNVPTDVAENIESLVQTGIVERGLFHDAALSVFTSLMFFWKKFSAERFSKPVEELKPPSEHKRAGARKPMMSVIAGMPYKKVYKPTDDEVHWSYSLNQGLRLVQPLKFMIARRVTTRLGRDSEGMFEGASLPTSRMTP